MTSKLQKCKFCKSCILLIVLWCQQILAQNLPCGIFSFSTDSFFIPRFRWSMQELWSCIDEPAYNHTSICKSYGLEPERVKPPGQHKACKENPKILYSCPDDKANAVLDDSQDPGCQCQGQCATSANCKTTILALEDTFTFVGTWFKNANNMPVDYSCTADLLRAEFSASYGKFDVFDTESSCTYIQIGKTTSQRCKVDNSTVLRLMGYEAFNTFVGITYVRFNTGESGPRSITVIGNWQQVNRTLTNLLYQPYKDLNTVRIGNKYYNLNYENYNEVMDIAVYFATPRDGAFATVGYEGLPWYLVGNVSQIVYIVDVDDAPNITNPSLVNDARSECIISDPNELPTGWFTPACNFGLFYAREDTDDSVAISGVLVSDSDAYENCISTSPGFPECNQLKILFKVYKGTMLLNTRADLNFISNVLDDRQGFFFTATQSNLAAAIKVIYYSVDLPQLIGKAGSTVLNYNTQHDNNQEYISLAVDDQGFCGWSRVYSTSTTQINITIVASNDAPQVQGPTLVEYEAVEDKLLLMSSLPGGSISITDVDVAEAITSSLAQKAWLNSSRYIPYINNVQLNASLTYGYLKVGYLVAPFVKLVENDNVTFATIKKVKYGHDLCRINPLMNNVENAKSWQVVCVKSNLGSQVCSTGTEDECTCQKQGICQNGDDITLSFQKQDQKKQEDSYQYLESFISMVDRHDRTCGAMPYYAAPNAWSFGRPCRNDANCSSVVDPTFWKCKSGPAKDGDDLRFYCRCCVNISQICSTDNDCNNFNVGSPCGCVATTDGPGQCGPYSDNPKVLQGVRTDLIGFPPQNKQFYGIKCRYQGPDSHMCNAPAYVAYGTTLPMYYQSVSVDSPGSHSVSFITDIATATTLLNSLVYLSAKYWNRLFRIPVEQRNPLTFNIEQDTFDTIKLVVSDLGNSGGELRTPLSVTKTVNILVLAVNNPPQAVVPVTVTAVEDVPFVFTKQIQVADPDSTGYGYDVRKLTINLTSVNGRLFLNEAVLKDKVASGAIQYIDWNVPEQLYTGLHHDPPIYGNGCQREVQCSDTSSDTKFGFFGTPWYGVVYSPLTANGEVQGCGNCPADAGNKFISLTGTLADLNAALSEVVYISDPNFNTRYGVAEYITLSVNDNGAIGENPSPPLSASSTINVIVESVNDRPWIGRRVSVSRKKRLFKVPTNSILDSDDVTDYQFLPFNRSLEEMCLAIPAASADYEAKCSVKIRQYIDVDEDTQFYITPRYLWISDVDANESLQMSTNSRRFCCDQRGPEGCTCTGSCSCGSKQCTCKVPDVCSEQEQPWGAGQLLIDLKVDNGLLTFSPPPGRPILSVNKLAFLTNLSDIDFRKGGPMMQCKVQSQCAINVSRLMIRAPILVFQKAIQDGYLSYRGKPQYFGQDTLSIWVSDQGYTDECYNSSLTASDALSIRVVGINDPPVVNVPENTLVYPSGLQCYVDFTSVKTNNEGLIETCKLNPEESRVPPRSSGADNLFVSDVDINARSYGNMTLYLTVGTDQDTQADAGTFFFPSVLGNTTSWYEQYENDGLSTTVIQGKLSEINSLLQTIIFNGDLAFTGYIPFVIIADDMYNFGECSGDHKCGFLRSVCYDPFAAEPHQLPMRGTSRQVIDVMIGAASACLSTTCEKCNSEPHCGWCPGVCSEQGGICMAGGSTGPDFQSCQRSADGRGWRECVVVPIDFVRLIGTIVGSLGGGAALFVCFYIWIRRRHGTIQRYILKKLRDFKITARKLHVMPPKTANYPQFFLLAACVVVIIVVSQLPIFHTKEPTCTFGSSFYMDGKTSAVYMTLDNCAVTFVPTSSRPPPEGGLNAMMIKFALPNDPKINLDADICSSNKSFTVQNHRPDSIKYIGYYCNVQILVPTVNFVVPNIAIFASGSNLTTVRTGPPWFSMNFGPNSFTLSGNTLDAVLDGLRVKRFLYDVTHGKLTALDLRASKQAIFTSEDADMSVTTALRTSVKFWQKSGNLVCLTGAPGSVYVNDACNQVCTIRNTSSSSRRRTLRESSSLNLTTISSSLNDRHGSQRILGEKTITVSGLIVKDPVAGDSRLPYTCSGNPGVDSSWLCSPYNPVAIALQEACPPGTGYTYKNQVEQIEGCTNLQYCVVDQTSQCLCKPSCDLDKTLDPPGKCDSIGQCCQSICAGYSRADLFPIPNQPRCPASGLYCAGTLEQQFTFTSTSGQISLQVLPTCVNNASGEASFPCGQSVSSYQGNTAIPDVTSNPDILAGDKAVLNDAFHTGGGSAPRQKWFTVRTFGPGIPDDRYGRLVWIDNVRHFVILPWILELFSFGLFTVDKATASVRFNPGYCPAFLTPNPQSRFDQRLIAIRTIILDTLQEYPAPGYKTPIPSRSLLAYIPNKGTPLLFMTDTKSNRVTATSFDLSEYTEVLAMLAFLVGFPLCLSIVSLVVLFILSRQYLWEFRRSIARREWTSRQFSALLTGSGEVEMMDVPAEVFARARARSSFFFIMENFLGLSSDNSLTMYQQWKCIIYQVVVIVLPGVFVYLFANKLRALYQKTSCQFRFDLCACLEEYDGYLMLAEGLLYSLYAYFFMAVLELALHILTVEYSNLRRVLRIVFYTLLCAMLWLTMTILLLILVSIVIGFIMEPTFASIYTIAVAGTVAILASITARSIAYQSRVKKSVESILAKYRMQKARSLPRPVFDSVMDMHVDKALQDSGLNMLAICTRLLLVAISAMCVCLFLFIGFDQFTDMTEIYATLINNSILSAALVSIYLLFTGDATSAEIEQSSHDLAHKVSKSLQEIIDMLTRQMEVAESLFLQTYGVDAGKRRRGEGEE